ncbi:hypothetical protein CHRYSEOSP005_07300 [Chryseobacterium sp. Alg-005]|uniref:hypothetical protein n=1 Tax=Chryseobacterium sp. Alg-005 TaxID=3159516 RepID=UPI0035558DBE
MKKYFILSVTLLSTLTITNCSNDSIEESMNVDTSQSLNNPTAKSGYYFEGQFVKVIQNGIPFYMWGYKGELRHIDSQATWDGLFSNKNFTYTVYSFNEASTITGYPIGQPLFIDNGLIRNVNNGYVYFREGNKITYITSEEAFNRYHFAWSAVQNVNSIDAYEVVWPPLY